MTVLAFTTSAPPSDLRRTLADCIADRVAADNNALRAKAIFERAKAALIEATGEVQRLTAELTAKRDAVIRRAADSLRQALKEGREPPPVPAMDNGSPALDAAQARQRACEMAAAELQAESLKANEAAIRAAARVRDAVEAILDAEASDAAIEAIATAQAHEQALDRLKEGLVLRDERRPAPRLRELQRTVVGKIDRRKRETARDANLIEQINWRDYLNRIAEAEARRWQDYANRLADDPFARPEPTAVEGAKCA